MSPELQAQIARSLTASQTGTSPVGVPKGLAIPRRFTKEGQNVFDSVQYEIRSSVIRKADGREVFNMDTVEVPKTWSQVATDILAQKYFRKAGVPQKNADGSPKLNADGTPMLGSEHSVKEVVHRLAGCWRWWGEQYNYFASERDAQAFYDEIAYMLLTQMAAPNSPQWFNTGLHWAHGINGPAQGHYYVDPDNKELTKSADAYSHPQPHACGRYDTKVMTDRGTLNLGEIVDRELVGTRVYDGSAWVNILAVKNNGIRELYRMTLANGQYIDFTDDHLILSAATRAKDGGEYAWTPLRDCVGRTVQQCAAPVSAPERVAKQQAVKEAALAGYHVGDGYAGTYQSSTHFGVCVSNRDEYQHVTSLFSEIFGAYTTTAKPNVSDEYFIVRHDFKETKSFRERYGLGIGSAQVRVSDEIFVAPADAQRAFLRGLFQADGCVRIRERETGNAGDICLTTTSSDLAHGVQILLLGLGIYSRVTSVRDRRADRHMQYHVEIAYASERKKFADQIGFISAAKQEKLRALNETIEGKNKPAISEEAVVSVERIGEETVYDIQTESGKFLANGVVVHNCFIQSVNDDLVNEGGIMDLWVREARLFKYGSGTGTNFSSIRGAGEKLSGGGSSSGLMSWLKIGDRAAGAIKSGGTTRRAAKMVIVDADHPDVEEFVMWKANEEKKVAALVAGGYASDYEGEAYNTVSGQNSNNSIRVTNAFMDAVNEDRDWHLRTRTDGSIFKTLKAQALWDKVALAAWQCADPGMQLDTTINEWHTCPKSGRINASNPCSEYMFLDNTACNLASINLAHFFDPKTMVFDVDSFRHASRLWTVVLEVSVLMAQFPSKEIAEMSYDFRTLGLGYANLGAGVLMAAGIAYDSREARAMAGAISAIMTGESYATSAEMAKHLGAFPKFELNRSDMLRVVRNHRRAAYNAPHDEYEKLAIKPVGIDPTACPVYLLRAARTAWDRALELGEIYGYRNAQTTLLAPTGTIGLLMDCATTGVEPDFALVKFKKLAGGGYFKIVNESIPVALKTLGYRDEQIDEIVTYMRGTATLVGAPHINHGVLQSRGFTAEDIAKIEKQLPGVFELQFAFNVYALGEDLMQRLGFKPEQYNDLSFNMLAALGFTDDQVAQANDYVCGTMTIEGAPHLKREHYPVFDCANKCGKKGERFIHHSGHIRMMASVQPFLSGAISKTINMPNEATVEDIKEAYMESWKLGLKAMALYRDGCKLSQPLSATSGSSKTATEEKPTPVAAESAGASDTTHASGAIQSPQISSQQESASVSAPVIVATVAATPSGSAWGSKRALPSKRAGMTVEAKIGNQQIYLRTGEYPDGTLGEIFIDMYREGAAFRSVLNCFAISVSMGLQHGVPLEKFVEKFTFTRFEPSGFTTHPNVKMCTSIVDYIFRVLAVEYLGRMDLAQVPPEGIEKNRTEKLQELASAAVKITEQVLPEDVLRTTQIGEQTALLPVVENGHDHGHASTASIAHKSSLGLDNLMGDAPPCDTCGHTTVRNGSCYRCLNCGASMGCS